MSWGRSASAGKSGFISIAMKDCLAKAITSREAPLKEKYLREIVTLTVTEKGAAGFWNWMEGKQSLQNYVMCWKFCFVLHKIFNGGHSNVIAEAQARSEFLSRFTQIWDARLNKASKDNYDALISYYSGLLSVKLKFHLQNLNIRVNLEMSEQEFYKMLDDCHHSGKDLKLLCSELMHYWDYVIAFLTTMHLAIPDASSSSSSVQCKLQPLNICLGECMNLYMLIKSVLIQLHADLEPESVQPLKDKFDNLFKRFREFQSNTMTWPKDSSVNNVELPLDPPKFEMVHSPKYCPINQTHFHGVIEDDIPNGNIPRSGPVATAPNYGARTPLPNLPANPPNYNDLSPMSNFPPPIGQNSPVNPGLSEQLAIRELRIQELEEANRILHQKVYYFETTKGHVQPVQNEPTLRNENVELQSQVEALKEELKQLKINSGQQFLQLYAKLREKDELLSQLHVEKTQYELLAQMSVERMRVEFQQSEQSQDSQLYKMQTEVLQVLPVVTTCEDCDEVEEDKHREISITRF